MYSLERKIGRRKRLDKVGERKRAKGKMVKKKEIFVGERILILSFYWIYIICIYNIYKG